MRLILEMGRFAGISGLGLLKCLKSVNWFIAVFLLICVCVYFFSIADWIKFLESSVLTLAVLNIKGRCKA